MHRFAPVVLLLLSMAGSMFSCAPDQGESNSDELIISVPNDTIPKSIKVKRDLSAYPPGTDYRLGKELYIANCQPCHDITRQLTGPALGESWAKYEDDRAFMYAFVRNGIEMMANGNEKAIEIGNWGPAVMLPFPSLTDTMINSILAYAEIEFQNQKE